MSGLVFLKESLRLLKAFLGLLYKALVLGVGDEDTQRAIMNWRRQSTPKSGSYPAMMLPGSNDAPPVFPATHRTREDPGFLGPEASTIWMAHTCNSKALKGQGERITELLRPAYILL